MERRRIENVDELIVTSHVYDHEKRLRSFEIIAEVGIARD